MQIKWESLQITIYRILQVQHINVTGWFIAREVFTFRFGVHRPSWELLDNNDMLQEASSVDCTFFLLKNKRQYDLLISYLH